MTYLLDTNACIGFLRRGFASKIAAKLVSILPSQITLCSVVKAELLHGAFRRREAAKNLGQVRALAGRFASLPFDDSAADQYAQIRAALSAAGTPIGRNDLMIAAIAAANGSVLVTHNTTEFGRISGLMIEVWET